MVNVQGSNFDAELLALQMSERNQCRTIEGSYTYTPSGYRSPSAAGSLAESESWCNEYVDMSTEELMRVRDQIQKDKKLVRNMFLVFTAFTSPTSDLSSPIVKGVESLQKNIRRFLLRKKFIKVVAASKQIQTAFRRHSAVSKWRKCLSKVPERTIGGLFRSLAEERTKTDVYRQRTDSLQNALQQSLMLLTHAELSTSLEFDIAVQNAGGLVFMGKCHCPAVFARMSDARAFFDNIPVEYGKHAWVKRAVLIDPRTPSIVHAIKRAWTEVSFRGKDYGNDSNFRAFMHRHFFTKHKA